jgi:CRP-like cAMP-binding protein
VIIKEGDPGDIFYIIESGSVDVFIEKVGNTPVATLSAGQYFGEMALLSNEPRAASCIAKTDVKCHILMRNDFILLLGDLESLIKTDYRKRSSLMDDPMEELEVMAKPKLE